MCYKCSLACGFWPKIPHFLVAAVGARVNGQGSSSCCIHQRLCGMGCWMFIRLVEFPCLLVAAVGARVKFLLDTPEALWGHLDADDFLQAACRFVRCAIVLLLFPVASYCRLHWCAMSFVKRVPALNAMPPCSQHAAPWTSCRQPATYCLLPIVFSGALFRVAASCRFKRWVSCRRFASHKLRVHAVVELAQGIVNRGCTHPGYGSVAVVQGSAGA